MALRISDMTTETTIADSSKLPFVKEDGLGDYLNRNITANDLKTYMQTGISGLPPGTAGKVMYYSTVWGKSANFETDGTNVAIGQTVAFKNSRLTIYDGGGAKDYTLFLQNGNTKLVTHKHGTTFIGNYDTNKETSGFGTAIKLYNQGNFFNNSDIIIDNSSLLKFGNVDNNGVITNLAWISGGYNGIQLRNGSGTSMLSVSNSGGDTDFELHSQIKGRYTSVIGSKIAVNAVNTDITDATSPLLGIGNAGSATSTDVILRINKSNNLTEVSNANSIIKIINDATIQLFNVPVISGGVTSGTLKVDTGAGNVLKLV